MCRRPSNAPRSRGVPAIAGIHVAEVALAINNLTTGQIRPSFSVPLDSA